MTYLVLSVPVIQGSPPSGEGNARSPEGKPGCCRGGCRQWSGRPVQASYGWSWSIRGWSNGQVQSTSRPQRWTRASVGDQKGSKHAQTNLARSLETVQGYLGTHGLGKLVVFAPAPHPHNEEVKYFFKCEFCEFL